MSTTSTYPTAPELQVGPWFNTSEAITLAQLRGRVVVIEAFQMLCPGCVSHGLPQASAIAETFPAEHVVVLGLHTVFEHHDAMQPHALEAFLHEYRIRFPVGVDLPAEEGKGSVPKTMQAYDLRGTPSLLIIDREGQLRVNHFGRINDMQVAAAISKFVYEPVALASATGTQAETSEEAGCTAEGCAI